jgi:hypothetical protein
VSSNFQDFDRRLREHAARVPERVAAAHQELAREVLADLVELSPVDEQEGGDFLGAWNASVGAPDTGPGVRDPDGAATFARGEAAIEQAPPFAVIYLTNASPHAGPIEHGWSEEAPQGVMAQALARLRARLARRR